MANPNQDARSGHGRYVASIDTAERDAQCAWLRTKYKTYQQIADEMGMAISSVHDAVGRALKAARVEAGEALQELEIAKLDALSREALAILQRDHLVVSHGRVITHLDESGTERPLLDDGPKLAAIAELRRLSESRRKLLGIDSAQKVDLSGGVTYEIVGVNPEDLK